MARDKKKKENEEKPKKNDLKSFLKKRAPVYLGIIALFVVFVIPELTKNSLESSLPELSAENQQVADILMQYAGPNESGLTVMEAISNKIAEEYQDERIYDKKKNTIDFIITNVDAQNYQVILNFESHKGEMNFDWDVNTNSGDITANNPESKHIIELVDYYD